MKGLPPSLNKRLIFPSRCCVCLTHHRRRVSSVLPKTVETVTKSTDTVLMILLLLIY